MEREVKLEGEGENPVSGKELDDVLKEAEQLSEQIAEKSRHVTEEVQLSADLARTSRVVLAQVPLLQLGPNYELVLAGLTEHLGDLRSVYGQVNAIQPFSLTTSGSSSTIYTSDVVEAITQLNPGNAEFMESVDDFRAVVDRSANKTRALNLMKLFGLDESHKAGKQSAMLQFETAYDAMNKPVTASTNPAITSLIPMRESIETALDHLLHQIPGGVDLSAEEGPNKRWRKISAIGRRLGRDNNAKDRIDDWAQTWDSLKDKELTPSKTAIISRAEWRRIINKATLFLISFLSGLDPSKLVREARGKQGG